MDMLGERKKELLLNQLGLCLSNGNRMKQLKRYDDAIMFYDMAIEAMEGEEPSVQPLIARSKAYAALPNHVKAREDAEQTVQWQQDNPSVLENDAFTLYEMDRFEQALVGYHQGLRIRQKPDYFANGVLVATETVEDCVGRNAGNLLENHNLGDTVLNIWLNEQNLLQPFVVPVKRNPAREQKRKDHKQKFFGERYLQRLNHDKQFLLGCVGNSQLYSGSMESYMQLQHILNESLAKVNRRQKTLMRLRPMYTYKMKEAKLQMSQKKLRQLDEQERAEQLAVAKMALHKLQIARDAQLQYKTILCIRTAHRAREFILNQPNRLLYDKSVYFKQIYQILGDLFLGMKEFIPGWTQDENDVRILYMMGVKVANDNEEEHLRATFLPYIHDPRKLLEDSEKDMSLASDVLERAFLYHEMGRSLGQLGKIELARSMSRRCAQEARIAKSNVWIINGMFMVARFESLQLNYVDAKNTITEAVDIARSLPTTIWADFLTRTLQLLDFAASLESDTNVMLAKREKDMLDAMPNRFMKMTMTHIFNVMSRMPSSRRLMLVPGVRTAIKRKKSKSKLKGRLSVAVTHGNVRDRRRCNAKNPDMVRTLDSRIKQPTKKSEGRQSNR